MGVDLLNLAAQWIENDAAKLFKRKDYPEIDVFYVGLGKTGSSSFRRGFPDCNTAHFHGTRDAFRRNEKLLKKLTNANLNIYDVIAYIARRDGHKPLIAETIREPISRLFSGSLQHLKNSTHSERGCKCMLCDWRRGQDKSPEKLRDTIRDHIKRIILSKGSVSLPLVNLSESLITSKGLPHSILGSEHFNVNLLNEFSLEKKFFYKETEDVKFLFTRFEEIENLESLLKSIGYNYTSVHENNTNSKTNWSKYPGSERIFETYKIIRDDPDLLKFDAEYIELVYSNEVLRKFYSPEEIDSFIEKYAK
tara:strand:- start:5073 stop:5993 length:921 start_codon:yes stop_codon:yes gene_type:complete